MYSTMRQRFTNKLKVPWLNSTSPSGKPKPPNTTKKESPTNNNNNSNSKAKNRDGLMSGDDLPQPQAPRFEGLDPWEPEQHTVLYCMNNQDNVPARMRLANDFVYYVSQSRSPGHKDQGQDCMAAASQGDWQVHVLCDGHDKQGHLVATGVCHTLPKILLRLISTQSSNPLINEELFKKAFDETARVVCWTSEGITVGIWVKVFDGQWAGKPGYIKEASAQGKVRVAIIDENGYHLPPIDKKQLRRPRYTGGCTCVCLLRNVATNECVVATTGDSRLVVMPAVQEGISEKDPVMQRQKGVQSAQRRTAPEGLVTPAHNVFNVEERARLQRGFAGQYEFDGNFLVNPITKFAIQPTRGFGDFDMFGTGYTHVPEVSGTFKVKPNSLFFAASDGVFDTHVWQDEEIISCLDKYIEEGLTNAQIVENMYRETLQRSLEGGYVDDISIYCYKLPGDGSEVKPNEVLVEEMDIPDQASVKKKKDTKEKRRTIGRNGASYTELSAQVLELRKKKLGEGAGMESKDEEKLEDIVQPGDAEAEAAVEGVGKIMKNLAASKGVTSFDDVDPKQFLAKSESFVHEDDDVAEEGKESEEVAAEKEL